MRAISTTHELYCLVPRELADELLVPLQQALTPLAIAVIVEQRSDRPAPYSVTRKRAMHLPRELPWLPDALAVYASELRLVQRMPPAGSALADHALMEVVRLTADGDGGAASELVFRISARVHSRLQSRHGIDAAGAIETVLGRVLDRLVTFDGFDSGDFYVWLDVLVDDR